MKDEDFFEFVKHDFKWQYKEFEDALKEQEKLRKN